MLKVPPIKDRRCRLKDAGGYEEENNLAADEWRWPSAGSLSAWKSNLVDADAKHIVFKPMLIQLVVGFL